MENPSSYFKWNCRHEYTHIWAHKVVKGYRDIVYVDGSNVQWMQGNVDESMFEYGVYSIYSSCANVKNDMMT